MESLHEEAIARKDDAIDLNEGKTVKVGGHQVERMYGLTNAMPA
jgi:hypothetical protein